MIHLASAMFFALTLLAACVVVHMMIRLSAREILLALAGELGREVSRPVPRARIVAAQPRAAL